MDSWTWLESRVSSFVSGGEGRRARDLRVMACSLQQLVCLLQHNMHRAPSSFIKLCQLGNLTPIWRSSKAGMSISQGCVRIPR